MKSRLKTRLGRGVAIGMCAAMASMWRDPNPPEGFHIRFLYIIAFCVAVELLIMIVGPLFKRMKKQELHQSDPSRFLYRGPTSNSQGSQRSGVRSSDR